MSLKFIRAGFSCDKCGSPFSVSIDPAYPAPEGWSAFDIAEDAARGSVGYQGKLVDGFLGASSVSDGEHLCGACTKTEDSKPEEE